ncbi:MAG: hypothetical protein WC314_10170 [Vulcanimicrobiota bacterium]
MRKSSVGFTLIEIIFTLTLTVILVGISLQVLNPGKSKAPVQSMAAVLAQEFRSARQLAVAGGHPVAVGLPTDDGANPRSASLYRLEGWNKPVVTTSRNYSGEYPGVVFLAARWPGPAFSEGLAPSPLSKFEVFDLAEWLPPGYENDYVFCFTPDGGLVTNQLPALDGRYSLVVADRPSVTGVAPGACTVTGAQTAITLLLSPTGGVDQVTGLPGSSGLGSGDSSASASLARTRTQHAGGGATVKLSQIRILPNPATAPPDQGICVPGQVVTLEVYAYDPEGRALFAKWNQRSLGSPAPDLGQFSYPFSNANPALQGEVDKMEFVYNLPADMQAPEAWIGGVAPPAGVGVFRARWNWTVPITSQPGDRFAVEADVRDAKGEVFIENPPTQVLTTPPSGRLLVERRGPDGLWQLVTMNPDGSGERVLSPPGVEEIMPSIDRAALKVAFIQGESPNRYVKVRNLNGGPEQVLAGPGTYTSVSISPDGSWVSYRDQANQQLITTKLDNSQTYVDSQLFAADGHLIKKSRTGWSQDSHYMLFEGGSEPGRDNLIHSRNLTSGHLTKLTPTQFWNTTDSYIGPETPYAPMSYAAAGGDRVLLSLGNNNAVLINFPVTANQYENGGIVPGDLVLDYHPNPTGPKLRVDYGSNVFGMTGAGSDNDFPDISSDGQLLVWTRSEQTSGAGYGSIPEDEEGQQVWIVPRNGDNFMMVGGSPTIMQETDVRRAVWIPAGQ